MKFLKSLQWRLVFIFTAFAIVLVVIVGIVLNIRVQGYIYENFKNEIESGFINKGWDTDANTSVLSYNDIFVSLWAEDDDRKYFYIWSENKSYSILSDTADKIHETSFVYDNNQDKYNKFYSDILRSSNLLTVASGGQDTGAKPVITRSGDTAFFDYARRLKLKEGNVILYF
jgi:two-component system sensor histidine kinase VicK